MHFYKQVGFRTERHDKCHTNDGPLLFVTQIEFWWYLIKRFAHPLCTAWPFAGHRLQMALSQQWTPRACISSVNLSRILKFFALLGIGFLLLLLLLLLGCNYCYWVLGIGFRPLLGIVTCLRAINSISSPSRPLASSSPPKTFRGTDRQSGRRFG